MLWKILLILFTLLFSVVLTIFINPALILNPKNLEWALNKSGMLARWQWQDAHMEHQWLKWNERVISGHIDNFCFEYKSPAAKVESCLEELSWNFKLDGLDLITLKPLTVLSKKTSVELFEQPEAQEKEFTSPDIKGYWDLLWNRFIPDLRVALEEIEIKKQDQNFKLDFHLDKRERELNARVLEFNLYANPDGLELTGPERYQLPVEQMELFIERAKFTAQIKEEAVPMKFTGELQGVDLRVTSLLPLPMREEYVRDLLLNLKGRFTFQSVKSGLAKIGPSSFKVLPAPLNSMDGSLVVDLQGHETREHEWVSLDFDTRIDLHGSDQDLVMNILTRVPFHTQTFKPGEVVIDLDFEKVRLLMPRIAKTSRLPQFRPDPRFAVPKEEKQGESLGLDLEAKTSEPLHLRSNLLDEALRLNFDMVVAGGNKEGTIKVLPLNTTVFKRPVQVPDMNIIFNDPKEPVIDGQVVFPLPEYKITMDLEGPMSRPRYAFRSEPPLPQSDIYSVLLFGRPMQELAPEDKNSAARTNQVLAQGILSLSVLYFLAGSPVEYVGFDPESKEATAQIGLSSKSSLRVSGSGETRSTGIRHSLGKGWYLDTSAESTPASTEEQRNYGVMLERIIAY